MRSQKRRRERAWVPVAPAPVFTGGVPDWNRTVPGWADVLLDFTFDGAAVPVATFELWWMRESIDPEYSLLVTIPSTERHYYQEKVTTTPIFIFYKMRYRNGAVVGPFSGECGVDM